MDVCFSANFLKGSTCLPESEGEGQMRMGLRFFFFVEICPDENRRN